MTMQGLTNDEADCHRDLCDDLRKAGRFDVADRALIELTARTLTNYRKAARHVAEHGVVLVDEQGRAYASPWQRVVKELGPQLRGMLADLGLSPAARGAKKTEETGELDI